DHDVEPAREVVERHREVRESRGVGVRSGDANLDIVLGESYGGALRELGRGGAVGGRREAAGAHTHPGAPPDGHACASSTHSSRRASATRTPLFLQQKKNSTLPSAPRNGDGITWTATHPVSSRPSRTSRNTCRWTAGSRTTPPSPTLSLGASKCGFTS